MNSKPSKNFDQIKPFLRMLEGSIDDARRRRLGDDSAIAPGAPANRNGITPPSAAPQPHANPIPLQGNQPGSPAATPAEPERPLRATPIKPKQSLHPSTGFRSTGS